MIFPGSGRHVTRPRGRVSCFWVVILLRLDQTRPFDSAAPAASSGSTPGPPGAALQKLAHLLRAGFGRPGPTVAFLSQLSRAPVGLIGSARSLVSTLVRLSHERL